VARARESIEALEKKHSQRLRDLPAKLKIPRRIDIPFSLYRKTASIARTDLDEGRTKIDFAMLKRAESIVLEAVAYINADTGYVWLRNLTDYQTIKESELKFTETETTIKRSGNLIGVLPSGEKEWTVRIEHMTASIYFFGARLIVKIP